MKKLILKALAIAGLMGSSAQGAAAMAAGLGAKAWGFLQASAVPVTLLGAGFEVGRMFGSNPEITSINDKITDVSQVSFASIHDKINAINDKVAAMAQVPLFAKAITDATTPTTWYGKAWKGFCYVDSVVDGFVGPIQKYMFVFSMLGGALGFLLNKMQTQVQPHQEPSEDAFIEKIAAKVAAAMPAANPAVYVPRRRSARRSGMVARA